MTHKKFNAYLVLTIASLKMCDEIVTVVFNSGMVEKRKKAKLNQIRNNIRTFIKEFDKDMEEHPKVAEQIESVYDAMSEILLTLTDENGNQENK